MKYFTDLTYHWLRVKERENFEKYVNRARQLNLLEKKKKNVRIKIERFPDGVFWSSLEKSFKN